MTLRFVGMFLGLVVVGLVAKPVSAQHHHHNSGHSHYSGHNHYTPSYNNYSSHHHHDAYGHRVDDAGHHINNYGGHTGNIGVYDNGTTNYYPAGYSAGIPQNNIVYRPVAPPPVPRTGLPIVISLPADAGQEVRYLLNGYPYSIKPGYQQRITDDRLWEIAFGSGGSKGNLRYSLAPGKFDFRLSDGGLDIVRDTTNQVSASGF